MLGITFSLRLGSFFAAFEGLGDMTIHIPFLGEFDVLRDGHSGVNWNGCFDREQGVTQMIYHIGRFDVYHLPYATVKRRRLEARERTSGHGWDDGSSD